MKEENSILMVAKFPSRMSGATLQMFNLTKYFKKNGTNVDTITLYNSDISIKLISLFPRLHSIHFFDFIDFVRLLIIYIKKKPAVIHFHFFNFMVLLTALVLQLKNVHIISWITMLGGDDPKSLFSASRFKKLFLKILANTNNLTLVCLSKKMFDVTTEYLKWAQKIRIVQIPVGVDTIRFSPKNHRKQAKSLLEIEPQKAVIIMIGAVTHRKGSEIAILAFEKVLKEFPETLLIIVGNDKWERKISHRAERRNSFVENIKQYAVQKNISDNVKFTGNVDDVIPYLNASDIFLLPSRKEGLPNVLLEAMASGLPTVTSDLSGSAYDVVLGGESGYITSLDPNEISEKICFLVGNPQIREEMGRCARDKILKDFTIDDVSSRFLDLYSLSFNGKAHKKLK